MTDPTPNPDIVSGLFKTYDIRGIVPTQLTPEIAYKIGRGLVIALGVDSVAVGRDMRVSSDQILGSLIDGIRDQGASVDDLGLVSTDALYFAVGKYAYPAGVMITASHNPPEYNGFKICREEARAVSLDDGIGQIRDLVLSGKFPARRQTSGDLHQRTDILEAYVDHVIGLIDVSTIKPLKIAVDAGNGMAGATIPSFSRSCPASSCRSISSSTARFRTISPIRSIPRTSSICKRKCSMSIAILASRSTATPTACS